MTERGSEVCPETAAHIDVGGITLDCVAAVEGCARKHGVEVQERTHTYEPSDETEPDDPDDLTLDTMFKLQPSGATVGCSKELAGFSRCQKYRVERFRTRIKEVVYEAVDEIL